MFREADLFNKVVRYIRLHAPDVKEVWLHGSRSTGKAKRGSDWDFFAVLPDPLTAERRLALISAGAPLAVQKLHGVSIHIEIATAKEAQRPGSVGYWAFEEGQRIWEKDDAGGNQHLITVFCRPRLFSKFPLSG